VSFGGGNVQRCRLGSLGGGALGIAVVIDAGRGVLALVALLSAAFSRDVAPSLFPD